MINKNNVVSFFPDKIQLEDVFFNLSCRVKEFFLAESMFDIEQYPTEYTIFVHDFDELIGRFEYVGQELKYKYGYDDEDLRLVYNQAGVIEFKRHKFYTYLKKKNKK